MGGWMVYSFRKYCHFVAPSCKLELARFSALIRIQDGAECGNKHQLQNNPYNHLTPPLTHPPTCHLKRKTRPIMSKDFDF